MDPLPPVPRHHSPIPFVIAGLAIAVLACCVSCRTTSDRGFRVIADPSIRDVAYAEAVAAHGCMQGIGGITFPLRGTLTVQLRDGEKEINGEWAFRLGGGYAVGVYHPTRYMAEIACNPATKAYRPPIMRHEAVHFWDHKSRNGNGHAPEFAGCAERWYDGTASSVVLSGGERVIVDWIQENGQETP